MLRRNSSSPWLLLLLVGLTAIGCGEPRCPSGYTKRGDTCYRNKDGGIAIDPVDTLDAGEDDMRDAREDDDANEPDGEAIHPVDDADSTETDAQNPADAAIPDAADADACLGSANAAVCVGALMHHCSAQATIANSQTCASAQQCQLGITAGRCAQCLPGNFQCKEARLERCANDGAAWELVATCDSAALCNETAGACTDKACTPTTRTCQGDVLNGCNASLTALEPIMTCDAGLCDQAQGQCDVCVANAKTCDADHVVSCAADGQRTTRSPCPAEAPKCTGAGRCVECLGDADCRGEHELCVGTTCVVQPYCGDGMVTTGEQCDPADPRWNAWTCSTSCRVVTAYTPCSKNVVDAQGNQQGVECQTGESCYLGICLPKCNVPGDCPSTPAASDAAQCGTPRRCVPVGCTSAADCAPGLVCMETAGMTACFGCTESSACPRGRSCQLYSGVSYGKCI